MRQSERDLSRVLIVIPCLNEERHLPALLAQLIAHSGSARIVVADGGSTDRSRAIVTDFQTRHANVRLLDNPARLQSAGVNLAVRTFATGHDWMVRIDAHCLYPDDYAAGLLAAAEAQDATSVVVPMITRGQGCFQRGVAAAQNSVLGTGGSPHRQIGRGTFVDHGHHALFRLDLFRAAGGYDEGFSHNEDAELDQRLTQAGARIWLEPALALVYFPRRAALPLFRQYLGYGAGRARTIARHKSRLKLRQAAPLAIAPAILSAAIGAIGASWHPALALLALPAFFWLMACLGYGALLGLRARSACVASAGPAAAIMHAAWSIGYWRETLSRRAATPQPLPMGSPAGE